MRDPLLPPGIKGSNLAFTCTKTNKINDQAAELPVLYPANYLIYHNKPDENIFPFNKQWILLNSFHILFGKYLI